MPSLFGALAVCALCLAPPASAQPDRDLSFDVEMGEGEQTREEFDIRNGVQARSMAELGPDAVRHIMQPALGGRGYVIELRRSHRVATIEATWMYGHPALGWERTRRQRFEISLEYYESLAGWIDEEFQRAERAHAARSDARYICVDGPGSNTERISDGRVRWMSGDCGDNHPNELIDLRLRLLVLDLVGARR